MERESSWCIRKIDLRYRLRVMIQKGRDKNKERERPYSCNIDLKAPFKTKEFH